MAQTIVEKLKLNNYHNKTILNVPADSDYFTSLEPTNLSDQLTGRMEDLMILFVYSKEEMFQQIKELTLSQSFNKNGYFFIAYPKIGNSKYPNTVHRDEIFPALGIDPSGDGYLADTDFKFSRMVKLDDYFTIVGLKYLPIRKKNTATSQKVKDYATFVPELQQRLEANPDILNLFNELTVGYQRNWARYIYSAKQLTTQVKRFEEMQTIIPLGYKSKDLYQQSQREQTN
ncbi:YdeI/OmpD-associated family protein [uncultured Vagococcus sp.]|uniref:YdeI/OmpD-associated family protein n=1 Tax=uncultured Vagococcus sp. TaxID=189676 RepID=UPI0028D87132|nr:YdeI/OmpD-associated family protein [uncultured Vagococcus sp.]